MSLQSDCELGATREKLRLLEERYEANRRQQSGDEHVRELSMRSLKRLINQLVEEIARFESRKSVSRSGGTGAGN
jgi:DNA-binding transcriptional regulator YbjK